MDKFIVVVDSYHPARAEYVGPFDTADAANEYIAENGLEDVAEVRDLLEPETAGINNVAPLPEEKI